MSAKIIQFPGKEVPHLQGGAICVACKHEWQALAPLGSVDLECPGCGLMKGFFVSVVIKHEEHWHCSCGCFAFALSPGEIYCLQCGVSQKFPYE